MDIDIEKARRLQEIADETADSVLAIAGYKSNLKGDFPLEKRKKLIRQLLLGVFIDLPK